MAALPAIAAMAMLLALSCRQPDDSAEIRDRLRTKDAAQVVRAAAGLEAPAGSGRSDRRPRLRLSPVAALLAGRF